MAGVEPNHIKDMIQEKSVNSAVGITADGKLVGRASSKLFIQGLKTFRLRGCVPDNGMCAKGVGTARVYFLNSKITHR